MAVFWTQHWVALPVIVEEFMGDIPAGSGTGSQDYMNDNSHEGSHLSASKSSPQPSPGAQRPPSGNAPFYSQFSTLPANQRRLNPPNYPQQPGMNPYALGAGQNPPGAGFDMSAMAGALPNYIGHPPPHSQTQFQHQDQRRPSGASTPAVVYQLQQNVQFPQGGTAYANPASLTGFGPVQYTSYGSGPVSPNVPYPPYGPGQARPVPAPAQYAQYPPQLSPPIYYYPGGYGTGSPAPFPNQLGHMQFGYGGRSNLTGSFGHVGSQDIEGRLATGMPNSGVEHNRKFPNVRTVLSKLVSDYCCRTSQRAVRQQFKRCASRPSEKTKAVRTRSLGRKSSSRSNGVGFKRPFFPRGDKRHRKSVSHLEKQLWFCQL
jgi:hypothetical protein